MREDKIVKKPLDIPFKEFMPGQVIQSAQFNDDMMDIEDKVNELIGKHNSNVNKIHDHLEDLNNPHNVTPHQIGTYTNEEIDEFVDDIKNGNLFDKSISNRVLDDECVDTRVIQDGSVTVSKVDPELGSQLNLENNISITSRYTKEETDTIIRERVGDGTYSREEIDSKFEEYQAGTIVDGTISVDKLKYDVGTKLDISANPSITDRYTKTEVNNLIQKNGLPKDWGGLGEVEEVTPIIDYGYLPIADVMTADEFIAPLTPVLNIDVKENVDARGEYSSVGDRLNKNDEKQEELSSQLEYIAINVKVLGAKGDGVADDTDAIQEALNIGGNVFIPEGTYKITKELRITTSNTKIFGYGVNKSILKYKGKGTEGVFLNIEGIDADNYIENISVTGITIDCTDQWYKGGNSDETPKETSPSPRYRGMVGIHIKYCKNIIVEDVILNDIYGDGIKISRSSHCVINRNKLYDCGAGNIIRNDYTGWDNHGDGIVAFFSYNIDITNNVVINRRVYLTHENSPGNANDAYGLPCGRSGLEFEYKINTDSPSSNPDNHPTYNAPGYQDFTTRDGFGLRMSNNYVYGYTKGIHLESNVRCLIDANKMIKNHIAILHTGGELTHIINNYISNEGIGQSPQIGYNTYCGGVAITQYGNPNLVLVDGNIIDITTPDKTERVQAICIGRACVRISNNSIKTDSWGIYETAQIESAPSKGVFIVDNEFIAKTNDERSVLLIYKYYNHADWVISGNSFTSIGEGSIPVSHISIGCENRVKAGGVSIINNIFNNARIIETKQGCNISIMNNIFYVLPNFTKGERPIQFSSAKNVKIENNRFYVHEGNEIDYCIYVRDNTNGLAIRNNLFYISNTVMDACCRLYNNLDYLTLENNDVETTSNNLSLVKCNWSVRYPTIRGNRINNPHLNHIIQATGGSASGLIDIHNNIGKVKLNINSNYKIDGMHIPLGFILKDYSHNANKSAYGEVCVVEGIYAKNTWEASAKYAKGSYFNYNDLVYKVEVEFTSGEEFSNENLTEMGKLCKFKTISLI